MDSKDKRNVWLAGLSMLGFIVLVAIILAWHVLIVTQYTKAGYEQTVLPGSSFTFWVKSNLENEK